jgi:hypothetical protein
MSILPNPLPEGGRVITTCVYLAPFMISYKNTILYENNWENRH